MPVWIPEEAIRAMHFELIREHGGLSGKVSEDALAATLAPPRQLDHYGNPAPSIAQLAAAYGFGLARNHCFSDGNKLIALAAIDVFLLINGYELTASEPDAAAVMLALAAGEMDESELSDWLENNSQASI
jgi:death-on-curing protein